MMDEISAVPKVNGEWYITDDICVRLYKYVEGMEDGIDTLSVKDAIKSIVLKWYGEDVATDNTSKVQLPYIMNSRGKLYLAPDDYIVVTRSDDKFICTEDEVSKFQTAL